MQQVMKLLPILAPIVMAALGRRKRQSGLDEAGLSGVLAEDATRAREAAPSSVLDALSGVLGQGGSGGSLQNQLIAQAGKAVLGKLFGR